MSLSASYKNPLIVAGEIAILSVVVFGGFLKWNGVSFSVRVADLTGLLAPLAFCAAVIERAVEILISPWRDSEANKLGESVAAIKARPTGTGAESERNAADLQAVSGRLDEYRGKTQRYAFAVSLTLSILLSIAGVRALEPFINSAQFHDVSVTPPAQQLFFLCVDVALSAALLAGGADGIHSVVNAATSFFDASADKVKQ